MIPVLTFHRIADETSPECVRVDRFRRQLEYLGRNRFTPITARRFVACRFDGEKAPERAILLTFDDGYEDNLRNAAPVLGELGFPATLFVISDWIGRTNDWDPSPGRTSTRMMSLDQLKAWAGLGLEIGSHTSSHRSLGTLDDGEQRREMSESKEKLESLLGIEVATIAYPFGDFSGSTGEIARQAGYRAGFATYKDTRPWRADRYALHRVTVRDSYDDRELGYRTSPWYTLVASTNLGLRRLRQGGGGVTARSR